MGGLTWHLSRGKVSHFVLIWRLYCMGSMPMGDGIDPGGKVHVEGLEMRVR